MRDISIGAIIALVLALLSLGLWFNSRRHLRQLRRDLLAARQRMEIERIIIRPPSTRPPAGDGPRLRRIKSFAPIAALGGLGELIRDHSGPAAALAGTAAVIATLLPSAVPHEPGPPPYASPEQAAPLTSPPPLTGGDDLIPPRPDEPAGEPPGEPAPAEDTPAGMPPAAPGPDVPDAPTTAPAPPSEPATTPSAPAAGGDQQEPPDEDDSGENGDDREDDPDRRAACLHVPPRPVTDVHACVAAVADLINDAT